MKRLLFAAVTALLPALAGCLSFHQGPMPGEPKDAMAQLLNALEANVDQSIDEVGPGEARMRYGAGQQVTFVKEDGRWRLKDLE